MAQDHVEIVMEPNLRNPATSSSIETMPQNHVTHTDNVEESNLHNPATPSCIERKKMNDIRALFVAARNGNWQVAKVLVEEDPTLLQSKLTPEEDIVLHVATSANCIAFVKELINLGKDDRALSIDLTFPNRKGDTAFSIAASSGFVDIAKIMEKENHELPNPINDNSKYNETPLLKAIKGGHKKMARYLFPLTRIHQLVDEDCKSLFMAAVMSEMYDIALKVLRRYPKFANGPHFIQSNLIALCVLARKPQDIASRSEVGTKIRYICSWICKEAVQPTLAYQVLVKLWEQVLNLGQEQCLNHIRETGVLFKAVKSGNVEFVILLFKSFPNQLIREVDEEGRRLFHVAILYRQEKIFNLIYNLGSFKDDATFHVDVRGNNMLHMAGKLPPVERLGTCTSRPHLQMQREILWFKEVEKLMPPPYINMKNNLDDEEDERRNGDNLTPKDLFLKEHRELLVEGETAIKKTADSCMLVATLISTIVFAAALVVPGTAPGSTSSTAPRTLIFSYDTWHTIFVVSNAVALFSSSTSIIILLSVLTSSFAQSEYIRSLQAKMMFGLTALYISITTMVIAFTAATFMIFEHKSTWVPYFIASLAPVPVIFFLSLHYKLVFDLIRSTYWSKFLFRPSKYKLF